MKSKRIVYLVLGTLSMLFAGIIYAWSILKVPLASYFGWSGSQLALNFTFIMWSFCIGSVVSGILIKKTSPRILMVVAAILSFMGFALISQFSNGDVRMLYIAYGLPCGLGSGIAYNVVISTVIKWFPDRKGFCSGVLMMSFGASSLLIGNVASAMFNSDRIGWRNTYLILGISTGIVLLIAGIIIEERKLDEYLLASTSVKQQKAGGNYTMAEMIRSYSFWQFFIYIILVAAIGNATISFAKDLVLSIGAGATLATTMVGILSLCNGLGRITAGMHCDAFGVRKTMVLASSIATAAMTAMLLAVMRHSIALGIVGICLTGISYGFAPTISANYVSSYYGAQSFAMNFSVANLMLIPAASFATVASHLQAQFGTYVEPIGMLLCLAVGSLFVCLKISISREKRPYASRELEF